MIIRNLKNVLNESNFKIFLDVEEIYAEAALKQFDEENFNKSILFCNELIQFNSSNYYSFYLLGCIYCKKGSFSRALIEFTKSLTLNKNNYLCFYYRGRCKYEVGDYYGAF